MPPRSRARLSSPSRTPWRWTAACVTLVLGACSSATTGATTFGQQAIGLDASSSGVCRAIAALPDLAAAERAFTNLAHDPLHSLAADPRLDRTSAARTLEAMQRVENDFQISPDVTTMTRDMADLLAAADAGLEALGLAVPPCPE